MRLTVGSQVPDFGCHDLDGALWSPSVLRGRRWLLSFYRYAACPLCNLRLRQMAGRARDWQAAGLTLLAVSQSPAAKLAQRWRRHDLPFAVIADPDRALYTAFGVEQGALTGVLAAGLDGRLYQAMAGGLLPGVPDGPLGTLPADFLVDADGRVVRAFYAMALGDHLPLAEIDAFAAQVGG
jgi:peroxiredoxin Q/BCP